MTPASLMAVLALGAPEAAPPAAPLPSPPPDIVLPVAHSFALMTVMRGAESVLWPDPFSRPRYFAAHYEEAFTKPPIVWDHDSVLVNYVGHGLFGSELYLRARQCRFGVLGAAVFAAATSVIWEYGFEGNGVRPSAQDMVYTPIAGMVLGEARYLVHRAARNVPVVRWVVDPFGEIERAAGAGC